MKFCPGARHLDMQLAFSKTGRCKASVRDDMVAWLSRH
jgi:hypothetical protein